MATRHPFAIVPEWILPLVSGNELATYCAIASFSDGENDCYPSVDRIAERCGKDRRAVQRSLVTLAEKGLIEVERRQGRSNKYWLTRHMGGGEYDTPQGAVKTTAGVRSKPPQGCGENHHPEETTKETTQETSTVEQVVDYLNQRAGKQYRPTIRKTRDLILARAREGFSLDDFRAVIDTKVTDWGSDPKMSKYLRPETLFGTKFEGYLNEHSSGSVLPDDY